MVNCHYDGVYRTGRFLKHEEKFFNHYHFLGQLTKCKKDIKEETGVLSCMDFCENYNPVHFNKYLEGELDKLYAFMKTIRRRVNKLKNTPMEKLEINPAAKPSA